MKTSVYQARDVVDAPAEKDMEEGVIYIETCEGDAAPWMVFFLCPCGCRTQYPLMLRDGAEPSDSHPTWALERHEDDSISLSPSVNKTTDCCSHFYIQRNLVNWCEEPKAVAA